jgi:galactoside O-acetyltransferase
MANYTQDELRDLLGSIGSNVSIHRTVEFFNPKQIFLGSNVRIDCFSLISAGLEGIHLHDYIHIAAGSYLFGSGGKISIESYSNISSRVSLFTSNDDYTDGFMTNPLVPTHLKKVTTGPITLRKHSIIGSGSIILPNVELGQGSAVGALSLVKNSVEPFHIVCGTPAKPLKKTRNPKLLELENFVKPL